MHQSRWLEVYLTTLHYPSAAGIALTVVWYLKLRKILKNNLEEPCVCSIRYTYLPHPRVGFNKTQTAPFINGDYASKLFRKSRFLTSRMDTSGRRSLRSLSEGWKHDKTEKDAVLATPIAPKALACAFAVRFLRSF